MKMMVAALVLDGAGFWKKNFFFFFFPPPSERPGLRKGLEGRMADSDSDTPTAGIAGRIWPSGPAFSNDARLDATGGA